MGEIYQKPVRVKSVLTIDSETARALEDPIRVAILEILSKKSCSIVEIAEELKKIGIRKALTTIRHHVDILKKAGLIELTKLEDVKGGVLKYYASNTRVLHQNLPEGFEERMKEAIKDAKVGIEKIVDGLGEKYRKEILEVANSLKHCPYCSDEHFVEYVVVQILNRAIAELVEEEKMAALLGKEGGENAGSGGA
jgi:DNA-binding transcriptional ArsR family regulator